MGIYQVNYPEKRCYKLHPEFIDDLNKARKKYKRKTVHIGTALETPKRWSY
jgi:hypothetical protein